MMRSTRLFASRSTLASIRTKPGATVIGGDTLIVIRSLLPRGAAHIVRQHNIATVFMDSPLPAGGQVHLSAARHPPVTLRFFDLHFVARRASLRRGGRRERFSFFYDVGREDLRNTGP